jgi:hypothetical protein
MHRPYSAIVAHATTLALTSIIVAAPAAAADTTVALAHLAPALGYSYTWIGSESAVALTRPGLYILVRTGNQLYDVNNSIETTAQPPVFRNNDIYVGAALVARLRVLAAKYAPAHDAGDVARAISAPAPTGALALTAVPTKISDAVIVSGSGPADVPLTITLSADIQRDMPRVLLSRTTIHTDGEGKFSVQISTAPLHLQKSLVLISATSLPGIAEAHTSFILGQPSPTIAHPLDELPRDFRPL